MRLKGCYVDRRYMHVVSHIDRRSMHLEVCYVDRRSIQNKEVCYQSKFKWSGAKLSVGSMVPILGLGNPCTCNFYFFSGDLRNYSVEFCLQKYFRL